MWLRPSKVFIRFTFTIHHYVNPIPEALKTFHKIFSIVSRKSDTIKKLNHTDSNWHKCGAGIICVLFCHMLRIYLHVILSTNFLFSFRATIERILIVGLFTIFIIKPVAKRMCNTQSHTCPYIFLSPYIYHSSLFILMKNERIDLS